MVEPLSFCLTRSYMVGCLAFRQILILLSGILAFEVQVNCSMTTVPLHWTTCHRRNDLCASLAAAPKLGHRTQPYFVHWWQRNEKMWCWNVDLKTRIRMLRIRRATLSEYVFCLVSQSVETPLQLTDVHLFQRCAFCAWLSSVVLPIKFG